MAHSNALYQPSLLELAQDGNCLALSYWMNSLLNSQGIQIQVQPAPDRFFKILINFRRPRRRDACLNLRERLTRFICYRLWTLNSDAIQGVRLVARIAGDSKVLWQTSVRINSPAAVQQQAQQQAQRRQRSRLRQRQTAHQLRFQIFRSLFISSITLAGFWIGYWLFYVELGRLLASGASDTAAVTQSLSGAELPGGGVIRMPLPPNQTDFTVPKQAAGTVISQADLSNGEKLIALTFDNGPDPEITPQILDVLQQYNVRATFFMSGINVDQQPDLARRVVAEGHAIGNRGWNWLSEADLNVDLEHEVDDTAKLIQETTGAKTDLFRPSTGQISSPLVAYAKRQDNAVILWSIDSQDPLVAAPILLDNVLRNAQPGRIVLLHDGPSGAGSATVQALPQMITALQNQGYRFVTVPKLLQYQHPLPEASPEPADPDAKDPDTRSKSSPEVNPGASPEANPNPNLKPTEPAGEKPNSPEVKPLQPKLEKVSNPERSPERELPTRKRAVALAAESEL